METARTRGRYGHRDATMILIAFRHGLRPAEACALHWDMVDLAQALLHLRRVTNGTPSRASAFRCRVAKLKREEIAGGEKKQGSAEAVWDVQLVQRVGHGCRRWRSVVTPNLVAHFIGSTSQQSVLFSGTLRWLSIRCLQRSILLAIFNATASLCGANSWRIYVSRSAAPRLGG